MDIQELARNVTIEHSTILRYTVESQVFILYSLTFKKRFNNKDYTWKVNRKAEDYFKLSKTLKYYAGFDTDASLPYYKHFLKFEDVEKLKAIVTFIEELLKADTHREEFIEFLELSTMSFSSTEKYKEGYVYKYGSGRLSNQKRCFNCCNKILGRKKRWLRITRDGLEYRLSNTSEVVEEVIQFAIKFDILYGVEDTEFISGIKIVSPQHRLTFIANDIQKRDEWVEAINAVYNISEFRTSMVRHKSSFIIRENNLGKFYIDGKDYFSDVYDRLSEAKKAVCISDWWLTPDMNLKRPCSKTPNSKIIDLLGEIADRGVKIYILLYKELSFALTLNSLYSKRKLQKRSPNIKVLRHPTVSIRGGNFIWSHHTKLICVDNTCAFLGGLDLCWGRWDTPEHCLDDIDGEIWPGIDYSNSRIADFVKVDDFETDSIDRNSEPRMPWHDVAISVSGVVVKDLWIHFMQVWNHVIKDITGNKNREHMMPLNDMTVHQRITNNLVDMLAKASKASKKNNSILIDFGGNINIQKNLEENEEVAKLKAKFEKERKISEKEEIKITEKKFNAMNIFKNIVKNKLLNPYPEAHISRDLAKARAEDYETNLKEEEEEETNEKNLNEEYTDERRSFEHFSRKSKDYNTESSNGYLECQVLRSAGSWNFGIDTTENSIHNAYLNIIYDSTNFIYIENQFFISSTAGKPVINRIGEALIKRIEMAILCGEEYRVIVVLPLLPAFEGSVDDPAATVLRVQLHWEYKTICRGKKSIYERLKQKTPTPEKYIKFFSLRTHGKISGKPVTEMIYVHSKLMIIDDRIIIIGSANINDRSMVGNRDSEIAMIIEDKERIVSTLNGKNIEVSKFAHHFRMNLFKEHSGSNNIMALRDPMSDKFYRVWDRRAKKNTKNYRKIFGCYPDDLIGSLNMVHDFMNEARLDLYEEYSNKIVGHLVEFPLRFLENENLNISVRQKEYLLPEITFT
ncbi:hypothetical protein SteCoe_21016 [Stentor coeruleus]|uniref:Phospholipase n=1 Tax=Stentor coeruleus TaxID=5963 RepID=A0A1R2BQF2_9CILI|nr:hypothetical protein SteCoe_21016 [Stentor coeruleus]